MPEPLDKLCNTMRILRTLFCHIGISNHRICQISQAIFIFLKMIFRFVHLFIYRNFLYNTISVHQYRRDNIQGGPKTGLLLKV